MNKNVWNTACIYNKAKETFVQEIKHLDDESAEEQLKVSVPNGMVDTMGSGVVLFIS